MFKNEYGNMLHQVYIQRLMVKLVQEQQSRARAQEKLEDALVSVGIVSE